MPRRPVPAGTLALGMLLAAALAGCAHPGAAGPGGPGQDATGEGPAASAGEASDGGFEGSARVWEEARSRGIDFRAVGQEPGWLLEIVDGGATRFSYHYRAAELTVPTPAPTVDSAAGRTTYRATAGARDLQVVVERAPCTDTMSGERFEARVEVTLDGEGFTGCGRWLGE